MVGQAPPYKEHRPRYGMNGFPWAVRYVFSISLETGGQPEMKRQCFLCFAVQFPTQIVCGGSFLWPLPIAIIMSLSSGALSRRYWPYCFRNISSVDWQALQDCSSRIEKPSNSISKLSGAGWKGLITSVQFSGDMSIASRSITPQPLSAAMRRWGTSLAEVPMISHASESAAKGSAPTITRPRGFGVPAPGPNPSEPIVPSMIDRWGRRTEDRSAIAMSSGLSG